MIDKFDLYKAEILVPLTTVMARLCVESEMIVEEALKDFGEMYSEFPKEGEIEVIQELIAVLKKYRKVTS